MHFLSDYYYYLLEIGDKNHAQQILNQLLELDPSNEIWHEETARLEN